MRQKAFLQACCAGTVYLTIPAWDKPENRETFEDSRTSCQRSQGPVAGVLGNRESQAAAPTSSSANEKRVGAAFATPPSFWRFEATNTISSKLPHAGIVAMKGAV